MRYFFSMLITDARNSGDSGLGATLVWLVGDGLGRWRTRIYFFQLPARDSDLCLGAGIGDCALVDRGFLDSHGADGGEHVSNGIGHQRGGGLGDDAAEYVGRGVACAKEIDCVDAGRQRSRDAERLKLRG